MAKVNRSTPEFIRDTHLADAAFELLRRANRPLSSREIGDAVFKIDNLPDKLCEKMVGLLLEGDARFSRTPGGSWSLRTRELPALPLKEAEYVVADVEITGHARAPHIIELAAYRLAGGKVKSEFQTFVNPGRPVHPKYLPTQIVDTARLEKAPLASEVLPRFLEFLGGAVLVAHNAHFDLRMINLELRRVGNLRLANPVLDTLKISRRFLKGVDAQQLPALAHYFNIPLETHHRATDDARALAKILPFLLDLLEEHGFATLPDLHPFLINF